MTPYEAIIEALQARRSRRNGRDWQCPAHDDGRASLSVAESTDHKKALLHCHAGCSVENVAAALGLGTADLFEHPRSRPKSDIAKTYDYTDEAGEPLFQVVRFQPKDFRQRRQVEGRWEWSMNGVRRVPYRLPALVAAVERGEHIWIAEGEKDVHALERAGAVATCNPGGAGKWRHEFRDHFVGAEVTVVADRDDAGRRHAQQVAESLAGIAEVRIVEPAEGKDAADHLAAGLGLDDFVDPDAEPARTPPGLIDGARWILDGPERVEAVWGDGESVAWAAGEPLMIVGPDGTGKTTLAANLTLALIGIIPTVLGQPVTPSGRVLYFAVDRPRQIRRRFRQLVGEAERQELAACMHVHPGPLPFDLSKDPKALAAFAQDAGASVVFLDSLGSAVPGLASDEVGSQVRFAMDAVIASNIELALVHHPRKATPDNSEPKKLADVYGSRWITTGCGSVVSLFGEAGDPIVSFRHIKQPASEVGPFKVEIDGSGWVSVREGTDLAAILIERGKITAREAAELLLGKKPTPADIEKTRRALDKLVAAGRARSTPTAVRNQKVYEAALKVLL